MRVTLQHCRTIQVEGRNTGYCLQGVKLLCERYGWDWQTIKREGIEDAELLATGNALAIALVEHARQVEHG